MSHLELVRRRRRRWWHDLNFGCLVILAGPAVWAAAACGVALAFGWRPF